jgi:hypothetical protein
MNTDNTDQEKPKPLKRGGTEAAEEIGKSHDIGESETEET